MDRPYSVSLQGIEGLPPGDRIAAEVRFIKDLERSLGSAEAVTATYRAWQEASECDASELSAETYGLAPKWPKAFGNAQRAGLKASGEGEAHFELHLARQSAAAN